MKRPPSIVVPIVLLVLAAALIATSVQFAMMFRGPPPGVGPVPIARVAEALRTGREPARAHRRIIVTHVVGDRFGRSGERPSPARDAAIAAMIPAPVERVRGVYEHPSFDPDGDIFGSYTVAIESGDGWIVAASPDRPSFTRWHAVRLASMLGTLALLALLAWGVASRISRPIRLLADAATRARLGTRAAIPQVGPREVRELAEAVGAMQARILQQAEGRTKMLAAIAHDLGTPLSRIAFWVEQLPEESRERAAADIEEMRAMLGATLRFTRDARSDSPRERLDLGSLIESLVDDLATSGTPIEVTPGDRAVIRGDTGALRRLFDNLIANAVRYGDRARIRWQVHARHVDVLVDDDGPGFPREGAEALFAPFVRGEESRNRATGGTGLGLAIARAVVEAHDGIILLEEAPGAGGRVRIRLPLAAPAMH